MASLNHNVIMLLLIIFYALNFVFTEKIHLILIEEEVGNNNEEGEQCGYITSVLDSFTSKTITLFRVELSV